MIKTISAAELDQLAITAASAERRRANLNVHTALDASVQRLFISTEPDTYIRPHRHPQAHKWEFFTLLEGKMDLLIFNDAGDITQRILMSKEAVRSVEIPPNIWHSYVCLQSGTLALEVKEGAYIPTAQQDFSPWSAAENSGQATAYLEWMKNADALATE